MSAIKFHALILLLLCSCATIPPLPSPSSSSSFSNHAGIIEPPPIGITIPIPERIQNQGESDFYSAPTPNGPWTWRTRDLVITTNADGTTSGTFTNEPPNQTQEFYLIVPRDTFVPTLNLRLSTSR
jgi:hypothetical protein